jgi:hypothetical protein
VERDRGVKYDEALAKLEIAIGSHHVPPVAAMMRHFVSVFADKLGQARVREHIEFAINLGDAQRRTIDREELRELGDVVALEAIFGESFVMNLGQWFRTCLQHMEFAIEARDEYGDPAFLPDRERRDRARVALKAIVDVMIASEASAS